MDKDEVDVHEVYGLGVGTDITAKGYVIFCKTRCCNIKLFKWFNTSVLIPYIFNVKNTINYLMILLFGFS